MKGFNCLIQSIIWIPNYLLDSLCDWLIGLDPPPPYRSKSEDECQEYLRTWRDKDKKTWWNEI